MSSDEPEHPSAPQRPGFLALIGSALSAAFGVQSDGNRERDFTQGNYRHFIAAGIVMTVIFVLGVVLVVRLVLKNAGV